MITWPRKEERYVIETWKTVAMGIVEGLTEFLPVSSTGHMIVLGRMIDFPEDLEKTFDIFIQLGAILAVVIYFRQRLFDWIKTFRPANAMQHPLSLVLVAFLPAAVVGLAIHHWVENHLMTPFNVAIAFIAGGVAIIVIERTHAKPSTATVESMTFKQALAIGCLQCLALWPGVSRSAATIMGALLCGLSLQAAAEFSFFLAIPTMFAASGYSLAKALIHHQLSAEHLAQLGIGFGVAFVVALCVVAAFMRYIQRHSFTPFALYRIAAGAAVLGRQFHAW